MSAISERALAQLAEIRAKRARRLDFRREQVYARLPEVAAIDKSLREMITRCAAAALKNGDTALRLESVRDESLTLQRRRAELLSAAGYSPDFLEDKPRCPLCGDTGFVGARPCKCYLDICAQLRREELSKSLNISGQSFDTFDISLFSPETDPELGVSPRENMEAILDYCSEYARGLANHRENLCFIGGTGLGKTFMSSCIAGEAARRGFSVVYDTAVSLFAAFEAEKFGRGGDSAGSEPYLRCDLLILDDLGTEMVTNFTLSALYTVINTRLISGKNTIISTNLDREGLRRRYTAPIMSRLEGEYRTFFFFGDDLRLRERGRGDE